MNSSQTLGPMAGVRVVELGIWVAAPSGATMLADWGADVVKVEPPTGDPIRQIRHVIGDGVVHCPYYEPENRGKRSVVLDLRSDEGRSAALALIGQADVFLTNLRPAALARLGLDHDTLLARYPELVYALVTGYGLEGPDAATGAYDLGAYWARGGVAQLLSREGDDIPVQRTGMGDRLTGLGVAGMVSAALFSRSRTGRGQLVTTSLTRMAAWQVATDYNLRLMLDREPPEADRRTEDSPLWNNYRAADGKAFWLMGVEADRHWPTLVRIVGRADWAADPELGSRAGRSARAPELIAELDAIFATRPRDEWAAAFDAEPDFFWAPVNSVDDVLADPQTHAAGVVLEVATPTGTVRMVNSPVDFLGTPPGPARGAPELGEHTAEVLAELGDPVR
ncbi:CaiB/BaiF CoA transferase family protein [Pseudonocardia pini]|uniref:CaiB/BaiF CoA transferase family protein n=1 Tax=Pseudonocardia pini TaxID=2758030 RepID=UPI0015EFE8E1|nr:CoA transferase [Pseudonocardia pini]